MSEPEITGFTCPPACDHQFDRREVLEWHEASVSRITGKMMPRRPAMESALCSKCGIAAVDVSLMEGP